MLLYEGCGVSSLSRGSGSVAVPWPAAASIWIEGFPGCKDLAGLHFLLPFSFLLSRPHPLFLITDEKKKQSFSEQRCQHFEIITRELLPLLGLVAAPNCPVLGWIAGVPMHYCSTVSLIFVGNFCVQASREVVVLCTQCLCRNASSSAFLFIPWDQKEFRQGKANRVCDQRAICSLNRERCGRRGHRQVLGMEWQPTQNYLPS